jgi:hypothetical protein
MVDNQGGRIIRMFINKFTQRINPRHVNLAIRGSNSALRLILLTYLATILSPSDYAEFGLIAAFSALSVIIMGGEVHNLTMRKAIKNNTSFKEISIQHFQQTMPYLIFGIFLSLIYLLTRDLQNILIFELLLILTLEYFSQELFRALISDGRQTRATMALTIRNSLWIVPILMYGLFYEISFNFVLHCWLVFIIISLIYSWASLRSIEGVVINKKKCNVGGLKNWLYLASSTIVRGVQFIDKAVIAYIAPEVLPAYLYFYSLSTIPISIAGPFVFQFLQRDLIKACGSENKEVFDKHLKDAKKALFIICTLSILGPVFFIEFYVKNYMTHEYSINSYLLYLLVVVQIINVGMKFYHTQVYSRELDLTLLLSKIWAFLFFIVFLLIAIIYRNVNLVVFSLAVFFIFQFFYNLRASI